MLMNCLGQLADQYQHVKFLSMQSTDCIPNYPDSNLPTLLVYKDGQCRRTIVGLGTLGVDRISPESALYIEHINDEHKHVMCSPRMYRECLCPVIVTVCRLFGSLLCELLRTNLRAWHECRCGSRTQ